jgi:hypothetical protein
MQYYAGFISAESLYMFRAQAPIIYEGGPVLEGVN